MAPRLDEDTKNGIRSLLSKGVSPKEAAEKYGISKKQVYNLTAIDRRREEAPKKKNPGSKTKNYGFREVSQPQVKVPAFVDIPLQNKSGETQVAIVICTSSNLQDILSTICKN